jgi:hypothetical protein
MTATLGEPLNAEQTAAAWRTALDPKGDWMVAVLKAADNRLSQKRNGGMPDAGGLVIASDHASARAYAKLLATATGEEPVVVLSDEPTASARIEAFRASRQRWMVAVRMVSEGVDIPRLAVGVYATSVSTPLFFAQAVGRFVRGRGRAETASIFLPSVPSLLALAAAMEVERDHILAKQDDGDGFLDDALIREANRVRDEAGEEEPTLFEALEASAHLDRVIYDGDEFGAAGADDDGFLGLPGLLEPSQVAALLKQREAAQLAAARITGRTAQEAPPTPLPTTQVLKNLKAELNRLVAAHHHRTGKPHGAIHTELRRNTGGPPTAGASAAELQQRIELLRKWATGR